MPLIEYMPINFSAGSLEIIDRTNQIIADYDAQGIDLTLRQVYYQFVSRNWLANRQSEYKRLGGIINDGRLAGMIDWNSINDKTRNLVNNSHWKTPSDLLRTAARAYGEDLWLSQRYYVEVWIEKDALASVLEKVCPSNDVPYFSCRGYTSQSEMWAAAQRINKAARGTEQHPDGRTPVVIHLGDHDPSGVDMTRDIRERLNLFSYRSFAKPPEFDPGWEECEIKVERIALNFAQIQQYKPPPNPAKVTDSRAKSYIEEYGRESWELDALEPRTLISLIRKTIDKYRDPKKFEAAKDHQEMNRGKIEEAADAFDRDEGNA